MMTAVTVTPQTWPPTEGGYVVDARPLEGAADLAATTTRDQALGYLMGDDEATALVEETTAAVLALVPVFANHPHGPMPVPVIVSAGRWVVALALADHITGQITTAGASADLVVRDR